MLDVAWLPPGLTTLKLCGITLSCRANRSYVESFGEAYAALLLRVSATLTLTSTGATRTFACISAVCTAPAVHQPAMC